MRALLFDTLREALQCRLDMAAESNLIGKPYWVGESSDTPLPPRSYTRFVTALISVGDQYGVLVTKDVAGLSISRRAVEIVDPEKVLDISDDYPPEDWK